MTNSGSRIVLVVVSVLFAVLLVGPACQDDGGATGSTARAVECAADEACPDEATCVRGWCMPECVADADCPAGVCVDAVCEFEPEPWACAADADCPAGTSCDAGACVSDPAVCTPAAEVCNGLDDDCDGLVDEESCACGAGETDCGGACVDLLFDDANCGACAMACAAGETCLRGVCTAGAGCASDADCDDGLFCTTESCVGGACVVLPDVPCDDGDPATVDVCDEAADVCTHGGCSPAAEVCNGIDDDCDGVVDEGCSCGSGETDCGGVCVDLLFDELNCGACGSACAAGQTCLRGICTA
ncbi:MAG: hypothetical protein HY905_18665 [Deltaproteobacteria bacterium]|nr:hypothetical protein [Deltaproteobacteria bacterium]